MHKKWLLIPVASALLLSACGTGAPTAPMGLDKRPANSPEVVASLTRPAPSEPGPVPQVASGEAVPAQPPEVTPLRQVMAASVTVFVVSDYSAPAGLKSLSAQDRQQLIAAAREASAVRLLCRTDRARPNRIARLIALRRGADIRRYLISQGVPAGKIRLFVRSTGSFVADNSTSVGRAKNRRVEIRFA